MSNKHTDEETKMEMECEKTESNQEFIDHPERRMEIMSDLDIAVESFSDQDIERVSETDGEEYGSSRSASLRLEQGDSPLMAKPGVNDLQEVGSGQVSKNDFYIPVDKHMQMIFESTVTNMKWYLDQVNAPVVRKMSFTLLTSIFGHVGEDWFGMRQGEATKTNYDYMLMIKYAETDVYTVSCVNTLDKWDEDRCDTNLSIIKSVIQDLTENQDFLSLFQDFLMSTNSVPTFDKVNTATIAHQSLSETIIPRLKNFTKKVDPLRPCSAHVVCSISPTLALVKEKQGMTPVAGLEGLVAKDDTNSRIEKGNDAITTLIMCDSDLATTISENPAVMMKRVLDDELACLILKTSEVITDSFKECDGMDEVVSKFVYNSLDNALEYLTCTYYQTKLPDNTNPEHETGKIEVAVDKLKQQPFPPIIVTQEGITERLTNKSVIEEDTAIKRKDEALARITIHQQSSPTCRHTVTRVLSLCPEVASLKCEDECEGIPTLKTYKATIYPNGTSVEMSVINHEETVMVVHNDQAVRLIPKENVFNGSVACLARDVLAMKSPEIAQCVYSDFVEALPVQEPEVCKESIHGNLLPPAYKSSMILSNVTENSTNYSRSSDEELLQHIPAEEVETCQHSEVPNNTYRATVTSEVLTNVCENTISGKSFHLEVCTSEHTFGKCYASIPMEECFPIVHEPAQVAVAIHDMDSPRASETMITAIINEIIMIIETDDRSMGSSVASANHTYNLNDEAMAADIISEDEMKAKRSESGNSYKSLSENCMEAEIVWDMVEETKEVIKHFPKTIGCENTNNSQIPTCDVFEYENSDEGTASVKVTTHRKNKWAATTNICSVTEIGYMHNHVETTYVTPMIPVEIITPRENLLKAWNAGANVRNAPLQVQEATEKCDNTMVTMELIKSDQAKNGVDGNLLLYADKMKKVEGNKSLEATTVRKICCKAELNGSGRAIAVDRMPTQRVSFAQSVKSYDSVGEKRVIRPTFQSKLCDKSKVKAIGDGWNSKEDWQASATKQPGFFNRKLMALQHFFRPNTVHPSPESTQLSDQLMHTVSHASKILGQVNKQAQTNSTNMYYQYRETDESDASSQSVKASTSRAATLLRALRSLPNGIRNQARNLRVRVSQIFRRKRRTVHPEAIKGAKPVSK